MSFIKGRFKLVLAAAAALVAVASLGVAAAQYVPDYVLPVRIFQASSLFRFQSTGGSLSPYLVGYFDGRESEGSLAAEGWDERWDKQSAIDSYVESVEPVVYLVNPTARYLTAAIVVFDEREDPLGCEFLPLSPNDVTDFLVTQFTDEYYPDGTLGVVKVFTLPGTIATDRVQDELDDHLFTPSMFETGVLTVQAGVKGWMTHYVGQGEYATSRESVLQEAPLEVLMDDANRDGRPDELSMLADFCVSSLEDGQTPE
jgi:hypothetical protein